MKHQSRLFLSLCALGTCFAASAELTLSSLVSDNMVLQQNAEARLWGTASPGAVVTVNPSWGDAVTARADGNGSWLAKVATPAASYDPKQIEFATSTGDKATVGNVLIGEVWLASGQSNMQMPLKGFPGCAVQDGLDEAINAKDVPGVRMFNVPLKQSYEPQESCEGRWMTTENYRDAMEFSATAWFFAKSLSRALDVPVGIVNCSYGGSKVESWMPRDMLEGYSDVSLDPAHMEAMTEYHRPMLMYNAMFRPVERYTYKGIIWYQGCSNVGEHENYAARLAAMVERWRSEMGLGEIPFYYVEIAPYDYESGDYASGARLREAQFKAQELIPSSGMVCTNDLAEPFELHNIHPRRKAPVGQRLGYMALNRTYGHDNVCDSGPVYAGWQPKGREAWVAFKNLPMGICRNYMLEGFELAGPDRVFHPATGWLHWQTNEIVLTADGVDEPVAVRYGFGDFKPGTLIGGNEQPVVPFRSDDW